jgi:hypothetical protein
LPQTANIINVVDFLPVSVKILFYGIDALYAIHTLKENADLHEPFKCLFQQGFSKDSLIFLKGPF